MPGASLPINGASRAVDYPVKKERPGYEWGPRWGSDGSSSPALAWGQALGLGGGDCQRSNKQKQTLCLEKDAIDSALRRNFFSLYATPNLRECRIRPLSRENNAICNLRPLRRMRSHNRNISQMHSGDCIEPTALARLRRSLRRRELMRSRSMLSCHFGTRPDFRAVA